ncbi:MAG: AAA family ATPase [Chloroflexi bacterium]|nr:AAA family ATPase [Chloroflexota bacterium]
MARLELSLLGPFRATLDGKPLAGLASNKVRALLAYLAVEAGRPHPRPVLAALLWPEHPDQGALAMLRHALSNLRDAIDDRRAPTPLLLIARDSVEFNRAGDYRLDVASFVELVAPYEGGYLAAGLVQEGIELYRGNFLEGFYIGDSPAFEEWATLKREQFGRSALKALHWLAAYWEERGQYERAQAYAQRQIALEPWREEAHQQVMRLLALGGQRSAALAHYKTCCRLLADELGVEPARETTALYESIRDGRLDGMKAISASDALRMPLPVADDAGEQTPFFVGRKRELAEMARHLAMALGGRGRVVFITGDAGSGKTALIEEFARRALRSHPDLAVAGGSCDANVGAGALYAPFRDIIQSLVGCERARLAPWPGGEESARRVRARLPERLEDLLEHGPALIDVFVSAEALTRRAQAFLAREKIAGEAWPDRLEKLRSPPWADPGLAGIGQDELREQVTAVLLAVAEREPLVLVLDDAQWADGGSIGLLFHLARRLAGRRLLILCAYRPEDLTLGRDGQRHPLEAIVNELRRDFGDVDVDLGRAEGWQFVSDLLDAEPNRLTVDFREKLYRHTDGHALFTVELLRGFKERGDLVRDREGRWVGPSVLRWEEMPTRVEVVIAERIGRLPASQQALLAIASVEGEEFTAEVVARVHGSGEQDVHRCLSGVLGREHHLVAARGLDRMGEQWLSRYRFRHAAFQRYLYDRLDGVERARLHEAVGTALESLYGEWADDVAVKIARHCEVAGIASRAADWLLKAGSREARVSGDAVAIAHFVRGLALLRGMPDGPERAEREQALQIALGMSLVSAQGRLSLEQIGILDPTGATSGHPSEGPGTDQLWSALLLVSDFLAGQGEFRTVLSRPDPLSRLAQGPPDDPATALANVMLGCSHFFAGGFLPARAYLEKAAEIYTPQRHGFLASLIKRDIGVVNSAWLAFALWVLGYPDQASRRSADALSLARELDHVFTLGFALLSGELAFRMVRGERQAAGRALETFERLAGERGRALPQGWGAGFRAWVRADGGIAADGFSRAHLGAGVLRRAGSTPARAFQHLLLADLLRHAGRVEQGLSVLAEALDTVEKTGIRWHEAELHRLKGEVLLARGGRGDIREAEASLHRALAIARRQEARSWELRTVMSLARLWRTQGKTTEARDRLASIYSWFAEGFDTPDLREARALLDELQ